MNCEPTFFPPFRTTAALPDTNMAEAAAKKPKIKCEACEGLTGALPDADVDAKMADRPLWALSADRVRMRREFVAKDFVAAMAFLNAAAGIAEEQGHHPDLHVTGYRNVAVELYTHSVGGLTENDFIVAALLDGVGVAYSPKWLEAHPAAAAAQQ